MRSTRQAVRSPSGSFQRPSPRSSKGGQVMMTHLLKVIGLTTVIAMAAAEVPTTVNFDDVEPGGLPKDWMAGVTGQGNPKWQVTKDDSAPSAPNVLAQTG